MMTLPHSAWNVLAYAVEGQREQKRQELAERLVSAAEGRDPIRFLAYLREQRRGYDPKHDGPSELMQLVDEIHEFTLGEPGGEEMVR